MAMLTFLLFEMRSMLKLKNRFMTLSSFQASWSVLKGSSPEMDNIFEIFC